MSGKTINKKGEIKVTTTDVNKIENLLMRQAEVQEALLAELQLIREMLDDVLEYGLSADEKP